PGADLRSGDAIPRRGGGRDERVVRVPAAELVEDRRADKEGFGAPHGTAADRVAILDLAGADRAAGARARERGSAGGPADRRPRGYRRVAVHLQEAIEGLDAEPPHRRHLDARDHRPVIAPPEAEAAAAPG